ncbi:hypothetical protein [Algihabitans albus]|uniref:hypothetical protein n=1 Tax=Algihabitans albus TaxID=2164067 RepID=UPI000E5C6B7D|nr:hypothetical protein [Algihabitans albus]
MTISTQSLDTLIDLVEIRLSCMEVWDRDDARELTRLQQARGELMTLAGRGDPVGETVEPLPQVAQRRRGRPRLVERRAAL